MEYQISEIVETAINNLSKVAEVNTIIGEPIVTSDGTTIMPVSQINFGFMAGGGEYGNKMGKYRDNKQNFAGGSGGGATLKPVGFLVISKDGVKMLKVEEESDNSIFDIAKDIIKNATKKD